MRIAYLECFSGISGDMFLGALIDAGVSPKLLEKTVSALDLRAKLEISKVVRSGVSATKVDVWVEGEKDMPREQYWAKHDVAHPHSHAHGHSHDDAHESDDHPSSHGQPTEAGAPAAVARGGSAQPTHEHGHSHRGLPEIRKIIEAAAISDLAKKTAILIFETLGAAEARVHNVPL